MSRPRRRRAAAVVLLWASFNGVLAAIQFVFGGPTESLRLELYWSSVGLLTVVALLFLLRSGRGRRPAEVSGPASGTSALAFAGVCLLWGLAWVFGVYLVYLSLPLLALSVSSLRAERRRAAGQ